MSPLWYDDEGRYFALTMMRPLFRSAWLRLIALCFHSGVSEPGIVAQEKHYYCFFVGPSNIILCACVPSPLNYSRKLSHLGKQLGSAVFSLIWKTAGNTSLSTRKTSGNLDMKSSWRGHSDSCVRIISICMIPTGVPEICGNASVLCANLKGCDESEIIGAVQRYLE